MSNKKTIIQKENFEIELEKEQLKPSQATNQLQNWCRLFECLSKQLKQATGNTRTRNKQAIISISCSLGKTH